MKSHRIILSFIVALTLASCSTELKLANRFVTESRGTQVAVYFPETLQMTLIQAQDSTYTQVLDSVNHDMFLNIMYAAYSDALNRYGLNVYIPDNQNNIQVDSTHWLVILSKVEVQGLISDYVDYLFDYLDEYEYTFALNTVNVAAWFDINDGEWYPTLFDEHNLMDDFSSKVTRSRSHGTQYHYQITPLKRDDVYDYAAYLGNRYAEFTFDYMMNSHVVSEMAKRKRSPRYELHWNPVQKSFEFLQEDEGFIELGKDN